MKMILAGMLTVVVSLTIAESASAAEQPADQMMVAMASTKSVCGGNTGKACPGQGSVATPPVTSDPKPAPAPVLPQSAPVTVPQPLAPAVTIPSVPTTSVAPSVPAASTPVPSTASTSVPAFTPTPAPTPTPEPVPSVSPILSPSPTTTPTPTPAAPLSSPSLLTKGNRVQVRPGTGKLNIVDAINGNFLGQQSDSAVGTVTNTPQSVGGRNWVYVDYDTGVDGWSTDGSLVAASAGAATQPTATAAAPSSLANTLHASYLGLTGEDKVGQGNQATPNGKPDFHISLSGLRSTPSKLTVTSDTGGIWETPYNGANWIIGTQYNGSGSGDLWFEQFAANRFHVKVRYADGTTDEVDASNNVAPPQTVTAPVQAVTPTPAPASSPAPVQLPPPSTSTQNPTPLPANGATYYVSNGAVCDVLSQAVGHCANLIPGPIPAGNDSNPGTLTQPWKTIRGALKNIIAMYGTTAGGVTLVVRGGAYDTENGILTDNGQDTLLPAGSSWIAPFTIQAYPGEYVALVRGLNWGHRNTVAQVQAAVHFPTKENCAYYHSQYPNDPNAYSPYPYGCVAGATYSGSYLWELQDDSGELNGATVDISSNPSGQFHFVRYVIFDGINIDSRGINGNALSSGGDPKGIALFTKIKFKNLEIKNAAASCFSQPGVDNSIPGGGTQTNEWEFSYFKIHHCGIPFDTYVIPGMSIPARESQWSIYLHGFYLHVLGFTCDHCEAYLNAGSGMGGLTSLTNSYIHDNAYFGIQGANFTSNNVFYNNGRTAMQQGAGPGSIIENNTIIAGPKGSFPGMSGVWMTDWQQGVTFQNNIIDGYDMGFENYECHPSTNYPHQGSLQCDVSQPNTIRNNLVHVTPGKEITNGGSRNGIDIILPISGNNINQDPRFVNPAAGDFRLQAGSPAIDKGYSNGLATDFAGKPRPKGSSIDMGAFEYGN